MDDRAFETLTKYLSDIPAVTGHIGTGVFENGNWWAKFSIDLDHPQAWNTVQELGYVLNYLSLGERLPTVFMPVSPPPYLNGTAREYLSWVIESRVPDFRPGTCMKWLEGRLPRPVSDLTQWPSDEE
jgi:hypothetical protein